MQHIDRFTAEVQHLAETDRLAEIRQGRLHESRCSRWCADSTSLEIQYCVWAASKQRITNMKAFLRHQSVPVVLMAEVMVNVLANEMGKSDRHLQKYSKDHRWWVSMLAKAREPAYAKL